MTLHDSDYALLLDYVDGNLSEAERLSLEIRLSNDQELASELESFEKIDQLQRAAEAPPQGRIRRFRYPLLLAWLASAAGLLLWLTTEPRLSKINRFYGMVGDESPMPFGARIAVLETSNSMLAHQQRELRLEGEAARTVPGGFGRRGDNELIVVSEEEYLGVVEPAQERWTDDGLARGAMSAEAALFVIAVAVEEDCSALVLLVDQAGRVLDARGEPGIAWPAESPWNADLARLRPGRSYLLPRPPIHREDGDLEYDGGFLVPLGARHVTALVALRRVPLDAQLESSLRSALSELEAKGILDFHRGPTAEDWPVDMMLASWLWSNDFSVQWIDVVESQH